MSTAVAVVLFVAVTAYAVFGGADFGAGFWDLVAGGADARRAAPRGDRPLDRPGVGGQPRLADLHLRRAVDRLLRGLRVDHADAVRPAHARRASASCCAGRASRSARPCSAPATAATSAPPSPSRRCSCRTAWAPSPAPSPRAGCPPAARPATRGQLGQPDVGPRRRPRRRRRAPTSPPSTSSGTPAGSATPTMVEYFRRRAIGAAVVAGVVALVGIFVLRADARYLFDELTSRALPARHPLRRVRRRLARPARCATPHAAHASSPSAPSPASSIGWGVAQWPYILPDEPRGRPTPPRPRAPSTALLVATVAAAAHRLPGFILLYVLDQKSLLPEEGAT